VALKTLRPHVTRVAMATRPALRDASRRARRAMFIARVKALAATTPADIQIEIAPDADLETGISVTVTPHSSNVLRIGPLCRIETGVQILLKGGLIDLGPDTSIRRDVVLDIGGRFVVEGHTPISWNSVIHCDHEIVFADQVGLAEQVTVADSSHYFTTPDEHFWHNTKTAPVSIGRNTWLCPKVTVAKGVAIGEHCIIGSNSVVVADVPAGSLASGVPATARPLPLPWQA
jgi:acetyltransferase-like isoleucine patch superfamily enzyme